MKTLLLLLLICMSLVWWL